MNRAYSLLELKSFDNELRTFEGIASTPTIDHGGDSMDPMGAQFKLPMPMLWQHGKGVIKDPVGWITKAIASPDGIKVHGQMARPKDDYPQPLRDELDGAWVKVRDKLVAGLSIGWMPIDAAPIKGTFNTRHSKWSWHETSAVSIGMNSEATINSVKSIDAPFLAATGRKEKGVVRLNAPLPGAPGLIIKWPDTVITETKGTAMKTIQEKISGWEAKRQAYDAARKAIEEKADEEDRTLTPEEKTEHGKLTVDLKEVDEHLQILRQREEEVKATAKPITKDDDGLELDTRGKEMPHVLNLRSKADPGVGLARYVKAHMQSGDSEDKALKVAKRMYPDDFKLHNVITREAALGTMIVKANVTGGITTDTTWGGALVQFQDLLTEFLDFLRPQTIVGKFGQNGIPALTRVDFLSRVRQQTSGGTGYWVGEGKPKPLTKFDWTNVTMAITKVANIAVLSEEEIRFSTPAADARVRDALVGALRERMDRDFIDPDFAGSANVSPAAITYGAPTGAASGTINSAAIADTNGAVASLLAYFPEATLGGLVWIMSGRTAYALSQGQNSLGQPAFNGLTIGGGTLGGIPVITSEYLAYGGGLSPASNNLLILVHAPSIFLADDGGFRIDSSNEASLQMLDNPTNDITTPTPTTMVSMFQTDSVAIRAERLINWKVARTGAVYYLTNVAYSGLAA